jgi:hypothetical protein
MTNPGHGAIGRGRELLFTNLLPLRTTTYPVDKLFSLSEMLKADIDTVKDGPDPEENLWVPAGYTYFGQFIDHDLTFDSTSSLNFDEANAPGTRIPTNLRTPRLDLDCVYGDGPDAQPFMYGDDGATLLFGGTGQPFFNTDPAGLVSSESGTWDLLRAPNGRAIIGDKRNDENSIVCQIQLAVIKYHNAIVNLLKGESSETWNTPGDLFTSARNEVRWTYQQLIMEDFLPRIIKSDVLADLHGKTQAERAEAYVLYKSTEQRANLPREFVVAAYRYGHSGVRTGYRLNTKTRLSIFPSSDQTDQDDDSLLGFDPLPKHHVVDSWSRFFPKSGPGHDIGMTGRIAADDTPDPSVRLQFAYKLDPTLVDPLGVLPPGVAGGATKEAKKDVLPEVLPNPDRPSLALLNLLRGSAYAIVGGQTIAAALQAAGKPVATLTTNDLVVRMATDQSPQSGNPDNAQAFQWVPIDDAFHDDTPLWFYVLAEAQSPIVSAIPGDENRIFLETELLNGAGAVTQLGWVGGRIIGEVFYALLDEDPDSYVNLAAPTWKPRLAHDGKLHVRNLLDFAT